MAVYDVGDVDSVNPVNGNLFLNIPLLSYPQRGHALRLSFRIYYNDKQWYIGHSEAIDPQQFHGFPPTWTWSPEYRNRPNNVGVYVARDQHLDFATEDAQSTASGSSGYSLYTVTNDIYSSYVRESDGAKHYYADGQTQSCSARSGGCPAFTSNQYYPESYPANDGSGYNPGSVTTFGATNMTGPDGVQYAVNPATGYETVSDTSGNSITQGPNGWLDSLGRTIPGTYSGPGTANNQDSTFGLGITQEPIPGVPVGVPAACPAGSSSARQWIVPAFGGASQTYYLCYAQFSYQTAFDLDGLFNTTFYQAVGEASSSGDVPATLLSAILLPNNTAYTFEYDSYLSLRKLTLPTGGSITYTWQTVPFLPNGDWSHIVSRALQTRTIDPGNGQQTRVWHYHWITNIITSNSTPYQSGPVWSVVTDPDGNDVERALGGTDDAGRSYANVASSASFYQGCSPHDNASDRTCGNSAPTLLKTESYLLSNFGSRAADGSTISSQVVRGTVEPTTVTTTWPSASGDLVSKIVKITSTAFGTCTVVSYVAGMPNGPAQSQDRANCFSIHQPVSEADYDIGAGAPGRLMKGQSTVYKWQNSTAYSAAGLYSLPDTVTLTAGAPDPNFSPQNQPASGTMTAQTTYGYDENNGSPQGPLGNNTSVTRWSSAGPSPISQVTFNTQGMPSQAIDPNGNTTLITYDSTGAFRSQVKLPDTGGVHHVEGYAYDATTGLITSHTDQNSQMTIYSYLDPDSHVADPLNRLRQITMPPTVDGTTGNTGSGGTRYDYVDSPGSLAITVTEAHTTSGVSVSHNTQFDGLGKPLRNSTVGDPFGDISVDTSYDLLGRVKTVSNPYRGQSDPSSGTQYAYDALGRKLLQTNPDGSQSQWVYSGNAVDSYDETARHWKRVYDAAGALKSVLEPDPNTNVPSLPTIYGYDSLANLRSVQQNGSAGELPRASRNFTYDSLSRLLTATDPETGNICYGVWSGSSCVSGYDQNGNLRKKTTGAPNSSQSQGITQTSSFTYDQLDRLLTKTYMDGTPSVCYSYDAAASPVSNSNGRLVSEWTQSGACAATGAPPTTAYSVRSVLGYDALGRTTSEQQCVLGSCSPNLSFGYDLAGMPASSSSGLPSSVFPGFGVSYQYDAVNRTKSINSSWFDTSHPDVLFSAVTPINGLAPYGPFGPQAAQVALSTGTQQAALTQTRSYDNRGRITSMSTLGLTSGAISPVTLSLIPTPVPEGVSPLFSSLCDATCGSGGGDILVDGSLAGGFTYVPNAPAQQAISGSLGQGQHTLRILYHGDVTHPSQSSPTLAFNVIPNTLAMPNFTVVVNPNPIPAGQSADIDVSGPCGTTCSHADIYVDETWSGGLIFDENGTSSNGTNSALGVGHHTLRIHYFGDAVYSDKDVLTPGFDVQAIALPNPQIGIQISPSQIPSDEYGAVALTFPCGGSCRGGHYFVDGNFAGGYVPDTSGNANVSIYPGLSVGQHQFTVNYPGDSTYAAYTTPPTTFEVVADNLPPTAIAAVPSQDPVPAAQWTPVSITVTASNPNCGGQGYLFVDGNYSGFYFPGTNGQANASIMPTSPGTHNLYIVYQGTTTCRPASQNFAFQSQ